VSQTIQDEKTKKRELRALVKASAELRYTQESKLWLITMDESSMETIDGVEIEILNVLEWLLFDG
jgi:hypothetical protein